MLKFDYVFMTERSVDFYLRNQLGSVSLFSQSLFWDDFCSKDFLCVHVGEFVAFGKAAFAKKIPSLVSPYLNHSCCVVVFFFNYLAELVVIVVHYNYKIKNLIKIIRNQIWLFGYNNGGLNIGDFKG